MFREKYLILLSFSRHNYRVKLLKQVESKKMQLISEQILVKQKIDEDKYLKSWDETLSNAIFHLILASTTWNKLKFR